MTIKSWIESLPEELKPMAVKVVQTAYKEGYKAGLKVNPPRASPVEPEYIPEDPYHRMGR